MDRSNMLVVGPPGVGKLSWFLDLVWNSIEKGENVVFVTTDIHPDEVMKSIVRYANERDLLSIHNMRFVDCYSSSLETDSSDVPPEGIHFVKSLSNIEEITLAISKAIGNLGKPVRILFYTVSTLFLHNSAQSVARFFQMLCSRIKTDYGRAAFAIHQGVHEDRTVALISSMVDGVVEMRFNDNLDREWRLHHLKGMRTSSAFENLELMPRTSIWEEFEATNYGIVVNPQRKRIEDRLLEYGCTTVQARREVEL